MKKTYIRPSFAVFAITTSSIMALSNGGTVGINPNGEGDDMGTSKKSTTDMWGNEKNKGIWD